MVNLVNATGHLSDPDRMSNKQKEILCNELQEELMDETADSLLTELEYTNENKIELPGLADEPISGALECLMVFDLPDLETEEMHALYKRYQECGWGDNTWAENADITYKAELEKRGIDKSEAERLGILL